MAAVPLLLAVWCTVHLSAAQIHFVQSEQSQCPAVRAGRVVCLQEQLCAPGAPLPSPQGTGVATCGPGNRHICCVKGSGAGNAQWPTGEPIVRPGGDTSTTQRPTRQPTVQPEPLLQCGVVQENAGTERRTRRGIVFPGFILPSVSQFFPSFEQAIGGFEPAVHNSGQSGTGLVQRPVPSRLPPSVPTVSPGESVPPVPHRLGAVGGVDADRSRWPWAVLLGHWPPGGDLRWVCGASLLSRRTVVTAAHCVTNLDHQHLVIRLGEYDTSTQADGPTVDRTPNRVIVHPGYRQKQNDIALLHLPTAARLTSRVRPICLPPAGRADNYLAGEMVELAGWGYTEFGGTPASVLQQVPLRVVDPADCEDIYRRLPTFGAHFPGGFGGTKLCAVSGDEMPRDACSGDSGGPLMWRPPGGVAYQLVGVVSAGVGCGNPSYPGIYTRVSAYTDWIQENLV